MKLLTKFEGAAEFIITWFFRKSEEAIQPVQVARELVKTMLKNKQVSISNVYVPNLYRVYLSKSDYSTLESFGNAFLIELARHIYIEGSKPGFTFLTLPVVEMHVDDSIILGGINIKFEFNDMLVVPWQIEEEKGLEEPEDLEKTTFLVNGAKSTGLFDTDAGRKTRSCLEVIKGKDEGNIFRLNQDEVTVGRGQECSIEVDDPEISRKHFKMIRENKRWFVEDLESTNGTCVNKLRVDRYLVKSGDRIKAGQTIFRFYVEE